MRVYTLNKGLALVLKTLTDPCVSKTEASSTPLRASSDPKSFPGPKDGRQRWREGETAGRGTDLHEAI